MSSLSSLIRQAQENGWCARWACTTCGSCELRNGLQSLLQALGPSAFLDQVRAREDFTNINVHVFVLRWSSMKIPNLEALLTGSSASLLLSQMLTAKRVADELRIDHYKRNDPAFVAAERERKRTERADRHKARLEAKAIRDRSRRHPEK
ncbi:MAG TPA: hypothetical protein PKD99_13025 [Sphingopyxis sp.]|nr:hypothetical protein [Sphingopyxis sp.]HMP46021.1 hypothetical protein [Sphingopyxis sp.]HMQ18960.1 hypothetical protein [Sphingopyxis sp.]